MLINVKLDSCIIIYKIHNYISSIGIHTFKVVPMGKVSELVG